MIFDRLYGVTFHKTEILITTAERTSDLNLIEKGYAFSFVTPLLCKDRNKLFGADGFDVL